MSEKNQGADTPSERAIAQILRGEYDYPPAAAEVTAHDLLHFSAADHADLDEAVRRWVRDRRDTANVGRAPFDARGLMTRGMPYPAALVFIDWHRCDPATAARALAVRM